jgi:cell division protein ZipA
VDIKTWILIGGGLLLLAVIGHGFWLAWRNRRKTLRLDIDPNIPQDDFDPLELLRGELPNGGARVRPAAAVVQQDAFASAPAGAPAAAKLRPQRERRVARTTPATVRTEDRQGMRNRSRGARVQADSTLTAHASDRIGSQRHAPSMRSTPDPEPALDDEDTLEPAAVALPDGPPLELEPSAAPVEPRTEPRAEARTEARAEPRHDRRAEQGREGEPHTGAAAARRQSVPEEVVVINVLARSGERFRGTALMEAFMRNSLKFGDMNIFHRLDPATRTPQFSVASAVEPGTFDLNAMDAFETRGVCLFMPLPLALPGSVQPLAVFEDMLNVARDIARSLGGDLKDEAHSVMTAQNIQHSRQRITDFTRRQLSRH